MILLGLLISIASCTEVYICTGQNETYSCDLVSERKQEPPPTFEEILNNLEID